MTSRVEIAFSSLYGFDTQADASFASDDEQTFVKWEDVRLGNYNNIYATYEQDFWLLDGNYKFMPFTPHTGFISLSMTDGAGTSVTYPTITITFTEDHVTSGLNLVFNEVSNDYPTTLIVKFYNSSNALIQNNTYSPSDPTFSTSQAVANFRKIELQLINTNKPYRYQRLQYIEFDTIYKFGTSGMDPIKACSVVEETNLISLEAPIDTLNFTVIPLDATVFNIVNPSGIYADIKEKQPVYVRVFTGNDSVFVGKYYLDQPKNGSNTEIEFSGMDALGILEGFQYHGWLKFSETGTLTTVDEVLTDIFADTDLEYDIDPLLSSKILTGYIPVCSKREALQRLAFAAKAYITCSRDARARIYTNALHNGVPVFDHEITFNDQSIISLELRPLVTQVDFKHENYIETAEAATTIYEADLGTGVYTITLDAPVFDITVTGATMNFPVAGYEGAFSITFTVTVIGTISITAKPMVATQYFASINSGVLPAGVKKNVVNIQSNVKRSDVTPATYAQYGYDYYQLRYLHKAKVFQPVAVIGDNLLLDTLNTQQLDCSIEKMSIDLAGGFVADSQIIGAIE